MNLNFWSKPKTNKIKKIVDKACKEFYFKKTVNRLEQYFERSSFKDSAQIINKVKVPKIYKLIDQVDWDNMCDSYPILFHGDLQPENIILNEQNKFILIDWRENFGSSKTYGDIYYDFAKLHHALEITGKLIRENKYYVKSNQHEIIYKFEKRPHLIRNMKFFEKFIVNKGFNLKKLKIMSSLVLLNIASLHHFPYSELLFHHGKYKLYQTLNNAKN